MTLAHDLFEIIFFICAGPLLAIIALYGLKQIRLTKQLAATASRREAYTLTADQCRIYGDTVIPLLNELDRAIDEHDVQLFKSSVIKIDGLSLQVAPFTKYPHFETANAAIAPEFTAAYNALNAFSLYFVSRIADERLAYATLGTTYCNSVRKLLPMVLPYSQTTKEDNVLRLFVLWSNRKEHENAAREFSKIQKMMSERRDITVKAIGT